ncbi:MAG: ParB/RepB/Spo0J family partition protein [Bacilli bacterium]|jgi:ParB family chromosome partitioning protein|nr:ParB/RepB/Spo0J family partition protein [Bacilli bacterium]MCH4235552.1 ParB/RepB/Spo0J family partition protein [Bacilli bacterium]
MKRNDETIVKTNLSRLVKKYAQSDVIHSMEREYKSAPAFYIDTDLIDDNSFLKKLPMRPGLISSLAVSFENGDIIEPLVLRPKGKRYEVVMGRKRLLAAQKVKLSHLPAIVKEYTDEEVLLVLLAIARDEHDVNPIEQALIASYLVSMFGYTQNAIATLTHQSRPQVTNIMRLLKLPESIMNEVSLGNLSYGHARALCGVSEDQKLSVYEQIKDNHLTVRQTEDLINKSYRKEEKKRAKKFSYSKIVHINGIEVKVSFSSLQAMEDFLSYLKNKQ